ncbi:MAG: hypothetical protein ABL952_13860 [Pyrinomonadaceae bacterium]
MKKLFPIIIVLMAAVVFGQKTPKASPVDEFGKVTCEELSARTDSFHNRILGSPGFQGLVVIHPEIGKSNMAEVRRRLIFTRFQFAKTEDRVSFVLGDEKTSIQTSYWIIPTGATEPPIIGKKWIEPAYDLTSPFMFGYEDELGICPTFVPRLYAKLLTANPGSIGHMVVYGPSQRDRKTFVDNWLETFQKDFLIPRKRFRIFFLKRKGLAGAEFWFVPEKS